MKSDYEIVSLTDDRQVYRITVQGTSRFSLPKIIAELNGWRFNHKPIWLRIERSREKPWQGEYELSTGHEIKADKDDAHMVRMVKPKSRITVTVAKTLDGLNAISWWPAYRASLENGPDATGLE